MKEKANKLSHFKINGEEKRVKFQETVNVNEGVTCDVYKFKHDKSCDLAVIKIDPGAKTPLQKVLYGDKTIEGYLSGKGSLTIFYERFKKVLQVNNRYIGRLNAEVYPGDYMRWSATPDSNLVVYEICYPPYKEGRFLNID